MALIVVTLTLAHEADGRAHYVERPVNDNPPVVGGLSVESGALPHPPPKTIRLTVEFHQAAQPRVPRSETQLDSGVGEKLATGDQVTIVKNTKAGTKCPPEWLQQYLGRTGRVLWTTSGGA